MSALSNQPENINYLSPLGFRLVIQKLPNVNYFCQTVTIPSISITDISIPTPVAALPYPGGRLTYEPLNVRFRVDENLQNYIEIVNWLTGLGHPVSLDQTRALSAASAIPSKIGSAKSYTSDGTLVILTSHKNPNYNINFRELFPISLTELTFDSTETDVNYLEATVSFRYLRYDISSVR